MIREGRGESPLRMGLTPRHNIVNNICRGIIDASSLSDFRLLHHPRTAPTGQAYYTTEEAFVDVP